MTTPTAVTLVGATGLTGSHSLNCLLTSPHAFSINALVRRPLSDTPSAANPLTKLTTRLYNSLFDAPNDKDALVEQGGIYVSCLGTTRAKAGGTAEQEKLDLGLNKDLATRAKKDGASTMILVSSLGAASSSYFFYSRMKGQLEDAVKDLDFEHTVILQPAVLLGDRTESRGISESVLKGVIRGIRKVGLPVDSLAIEGADIGACIAHLAANPPSEKVLIIGDHEIIAYAKQFRAAQAQSSK
ncbi:endoplasmic reticulum protein [Cryptococcus deuterogattii 99/473]|uniref:Endoplasmic reticulum protein n=2 Tax=Cryptococcus deuterogattii TaxID=1859096 RepID=A0A0D0UWI1_9TREE|nr:endoplasmic reticulum protein [Cryptococcus deuterogattii R265]KIR29554.1 endoplasmic reticulum protein [Cryptococcus deuterogattii LA55]KIR34482.1 endoplasmic reticulum protein [Cryptococcus deuterogattii MMRL2647]KIR39581.1 endoplasmic reticulum protein [Cryptococcus deuterogattii Ram5]KIR73917.1 endoplasmic reticulum protein [Cryptococcus deuterogattii CA1014]KIR93408.1 endoplasmic reticulum protein [Cryptococcus deuterogattii CBS 10090]KIY59211.1 endoplasmic reticulum protein [Cryptoco